MDVNYKLITPTGEEITADAVNWVTWNVDGGGIKAAHNGPEAGRSLVMDMKTIPMDMLLALSERNFEGMRDVKIPDPYKYLSKPIANVIEFSTSKIVFETEDGQFELLISTNPNWVRPRSPFSLG